MVETAMIFALGFLAATLLALLVIPAVNARAERLARRRAEALFPLSVAELTAEKDHLRAEFAVQQIRLERRADGALAQRHQTLEEVGRQALRIDTLEADLGGREQTILQLENDLAGLRLEVATRTEDVAVTRADLAAGREVLAALEEANRKTLDELAALRAQLPATSEEDASELQTVRVTVEAAEPKTPSGEFAEYDGRRNGLLNDIDAKRITISDLETRLTTQTSRASDFERALSGHKIELAEERARVASLEQHLRSEQERVRTLEAKLAEAEKRAASPSEDVRAENDALRDLVASVADQIVASSPAPSRRRRKLSS